ncbi:unnamed protein product [Caenorhabditis nigoni]
MSPHTEVHWIEIRGASGPQILAESAGLGCIGEVLSTTDMITLDIQLLLNDFLNSGSPDYQSPALSGKNGPKAGPPVPSSDRRSQRIATTVPLFRQRSQCPENGPNVPTTVQRVTDNDYHISPVEAPIRIFEEPDQRRDHRLVNQFGPSSSLQNSE